MVQSIDNNINKPTYNAVKIHIKNPTINKENSNQQVTDNGIYNAVDINVDNPSINTNTRKIYDYPLAQNPITYDMANIHPIDLPKGFHVAYQTTNVILPKIENEIELESPKGGDYEEIDFTEEIEPEQDINSEEEIPVSEKKEVVVPEPNYTTIEAEKGSDNLKELKDEIIDDVKIMETEVKESEDKRADVSEIKRPEIIESEEIKPKVDIPLVLSNLSNPNFDIQAQQMEEIARISLDNPENAVPYIVREVFSSLIDISKKDTMNLDTPTNEQIDARKKVIANFIALEENKNSNNSSSLPYNLTQQEITLANELSPMEQAERNKEYALYTMAVLAKVYIDEVEKQTGNVVPLTDIPGSSAMVDALRFNPNSGVKIAALDALRHIQRPEYKDELTTIYTLAQTDTNPDVSITATRALERLN